MSVVFTNNATSTLAAAITAAQTTIAVQTADAALFPQPAAGDWFPVTVVEGANMEICRATARSGATLTVTRGQEGTTAKAFGAGVLVDHRLTKAALDELGSPAQILAKLLTVDGTGSGLDADTLDGADGAAYLNRANHTGTEPISAVSGLQPALDAKAALDSPTLTGDPKAPTPIAGDNDTSIATTAFVKAAITAAGGPTAEARNRICNPAFQISQENGDTANSANNYYFADQWRSVVTGGGVMNANRLTQGGVANRPGGATFYGRFVCATADTSIAATEFYGFLQNIEGLQVADFEWGLSSAKPAILRFSIFASVAGTYAIGLRNTAGDRSFVAPVTISAGEVNQFVERAIVIPGPTSGTFAVDETIGLTITFTVAAGTTYQTPVVNSWQNGTFLGVPGQSNGMATVNNDFRFCNFGLYLDRDNTGLPPKWQLPNFGDELARCQRYFATSVYLISSGSQVTSGVGTYYATCSLPVTMRGGASLSGVNASNAMFAATVGTLTLGGTNTIREQRVPNATGFGVYSSYLTANARF